MKKEKSNTIIEVSSKTRNVKQFMNIIIKYTDIKELDAKILNEFIDKVVIHEPIYEETILEQRIDIYYKFVGIL